MEQYCIFYGSINIERVANDLSNSRAVITSMEEEKGKGRWARVLIMSVILYYFKLSVLEAQEWWLTPIYNPSYLGCRDRRITD
jgi:hypothetical protein